MFPMGQSICMVSIEMPISLWPRASIDEVHGYSCPINPAEQGWREGIVWGVPAPSDKARQTGTQMACANNYAKRGPKC